MTATERWTSKNSFRAYLNSVSRVIKRRNYGELKLWKYFLSNIWIYWKVKPCFHLSKLITRYYLYWSFYRFAFRIYDIDNDGYISNGELFQVIITKEELLAVDIQRKSRYLLTLSFYIYFLLQVLKMMVGNNLKETQLQQIVDKTILFADKDGDGKISFEEFCDVVGNTDVHKKMVVDVWF